MPNLHIIIGDANTRKSSLLRCLTGIGSGTATRYIDVARGSGGTITVYCMLSALQESYDPRQPAEFIKYIRALVHQPTDVAFTLRVRARGAYPPAVNYLQSFALAGWPVASLALLGPSACSLSVAGTGGAVCAVPLSPNQPTNQTAAQVRKIWNWL